MRAIILAGGKSSRLLPITENTPKCLLEIGGATILGNLLKALEYNNVKEIIIVTGHHENQIIEYIHKEWSQLKITFINNNDVENTGPAYGLWLARKYFDEHFIYLNSDLLCDTAVIDRLCTNTQTDSLTAVQRIAWNQEAVNITLGKEDSITDIGKHITSEDSNGEFIGATRFNKQFAQSLENKLNTFVEQGEKKKFAADGINSVIQEDRLILRALDVTDLPGIEIDTADDLNRARLIWKRNNIKTLTRKCITLLDILITYPLFLLSLLFPRDKQRFVFIGWHNSPQGEIFSDNTKYLFLYTKQNAPSITPIWLAKDEKLAHMLRKRGYISYREDSIQGIWHGLRAGFTILDAYIQRKNFRLSGRSKIVQLLHGKGMKKGGYAKKQYRKQDYIFGTSQFTLDLLPISFTKQSKKFVTGYSRDLVLTKNVLDSDISSDIETIRTIETLRTVGTRCILYAPTYRRGFPHFDIPSILNLEKLNPWLLENKIKLFITLHPKYRKQVRNLTYESIHLLDESDIQTLLPHFDILITDYSSIFTDFLLLDKPIIFFPFDFDTYEQSEGISINYELMTPGEKVYNPEKLSETIQSVLTKDVWVTERKKVREKYHTYTDGEGSNRILSILSKEENIKLR